MQLFKDKEKKEFYRSLLAMVVPLALQNLINVATQAADVVMLGRVGQAQLSAASLAGQIQFILLLVFFGIAAGATVLTSQYWGKGDIPAIEKILSMALRFSVAASFVFFLAALIIPGWLMRMFTPDPEIIAYGVNYLRAVAPSYLFMGFTNCYLILMRSIEQVKFAAFVYLLSLVANVSLNAVFIFGLLGAPALGILGAAIATSIARLVEFVVVMIYALRNPVVKLRAKNFLSWDKLLLKDYLKYSGPTLLNEVLWGVGVSVNVAIIGHLGSDAVSANSVAQVMRQFATVVCFGLANATAVLVGKALGANDRAKAELCGRRFVVLSLITGALGGAVILLLRPLVLFYTKATLSATAHEYLSFFLIVMSFAVVVQAYNATMVVGIFRGGGDTKFGAIVDLIGLWGFSIVTAFIAAFLLGWPPQIVYILVYSDELIKFPLATIRYKSKIWLRNITR